MGNLKLALLDGTKNSEMYLLYIKRLEYVRGNLPSLACIHEIVVPQLLTALPYNPLVFHHILGGLL